MASFFKNNGSFLLSLIIAVLTAGFYYGVIKGDIERQKEIATVITTDLKDAKDHGTPYARELRKDLVHHVENVVEIKKSADKALEMLGNQRETLAEMRQQIAYLVQVCGKQERNHVYGPYDYGKPAMADNSR